MTAILQRLPQSYVFFFGKFTLIFVRKKNGIFTEINSDFTILSLITTSHQKNLPPEKCVFPRLFSTVYPRIYKTSSTDTSAVHFVPPTHTLTCIFIKFDKCASSKIGQARKCKIE